MTGDLVDSAANKQAGRDGRRFLQKPFRIADLLSLLSESISPATILRPKVPAS
jgi:hypothetical protein